MSTRWSGILDSTGKRERVTWRLDPSNYDFVDHERMRMRLTSMNATLNVILAEHRERCCQIDSKVTAKPSRRQDNPTILKT